MSRVIRLQTLIDVVIGLLVGWLSAYLTVEISVTILFGLGGVPALVAVVPASMRVARDRRRFLLSCCAFAAGFAAAYIGILVPAHLSCVPPQCIGEDWGFDLLGALGTLIVIAIGAALTVVFLRRRPSGA